MGKIYCEEIHHQIFSAYDPAIQINLTSTLTQNDDCCRFAVFMRPSNKISEPAWIIGYKENHSE